MCVCVRNNLVKLMWILKCFGIWVCIFFHCCICVMRNMCNHSQSAATLNSFILFVRNCKTTEELPISTEETELNPEQNLFLLDNNWWVLTAVFLVSAFPFIKLQCPHTYITLLPPLATQSSSHCECSRLRCGLSTTLGRAGVFGDCDSAWSLARQERCPLRVAASMSSESQRLQAVPIMKNGSRGDTSEGSS